MIITLDGSTASGKSSIARALAHKLGAVHFNSGFIYRCIGYIAAREHGFTKESIQTISQVLAQEIVHNIVYEYTDTASIRFNGVDITHELKYAHIDVLASCVSELAHVREVVNEYARVLTRSSYLCHPELGSGSSPILIADGRDCGTVMFPHAQHKFFITASPVVRAQRWRQDQQKQGKRYTLEQALALVNERDMRDTMRVVAPLKQADDAVIVDTGELSMDAIIQFLENIIVV